MYDLIIVGAGVAGLTSAIYALRANKKVLILEKKSYGGQIIESLEVENYPGFLKISGFDLVNNIYKQVKSLGGEIKYEDVEKITSEKSVITNKNEYNAKSIILATGLVPRKLNINNEDKFIGKGISYCATCDGNFYKGLDVCVVGGGNTAMEDALYLANICNKVYLIHRRAEFRGENSLLEKLKNLNNVEIIYKEIIKSINGNENLNFITLSDNREINVSGLFVAIGRIPNNQNFKELINLDKDGFILVNEKQETNISGVFAAGDATSNTVKQLVTATSDGAVAAINAISYLNK